MTSWSSSSSMYACQEWFEYSSGSYEYTTEIPFHSAMGQPLIYYAQVEEPTSQRRKRAEVRKRNPNCFVKAFRWYTKEHHPSDNTKTTNVDLVDFATWLDDKYEQYSQENRLNETSSRLVVRNTSTTMTGINTNAICGACEQSLSQKPPKRRPWKKLRGFTRKEKEVGQVRSCHSLEFIMQPKDLNRSFSRCNPYINCSNKTSTINDYKTRVIRKSDKRTQSLANLPLTKESSHTIIDVKAYRNGIEDKVERVIRTKNYEESMVKSDQNVKRKTEGTGCQCSKEVVLKVDADTEYEWLRNTGPKTRDESKAKNGKIKQNKFIQTHRKQTEDRNISCECLKTVKVDAQTQYFRKLLIGPENICDYYCDCKSIAQDHMRQLIIGLGENQKRPTETVRFQNATFSQTSDYAININEQPYPLFMKILRADKLKE